MVKARAYIKIVRPVNSLMTGASVALGFWLARSTLAPIQLIVLIIAAMAAVGFGNIINDIMDIDTDRISHPDRPLATGELAPRTAWLYLQILGLVAIAAAIAVSPTHAAGTIIPLTVLSLYAIFLKGTPLAGNIIVSALVGYAPLFGAIGAPGLGQLYAPAGCACAVNLCREIVKDLQDQQGDQQAGLKTTAVLPLNILRWIVGIISLVYLALIPIPWALGQFHSIYIVICAAALLPLHGWWLSLFLRNSWRDSVRRISLLIKLELLGGLFALALDRLIIP
jgi:geranylgeranylglycerol-phosphate geranylgeranyltransferase